MAHCPLCGNPVEPGRRRQLAGRIARNRKTVSEAVDALMRRHRHKEDLAEKAIERAYEKGRSDGEKISAKHLKILQETSAWFKERPFRQARALLARAPALLSGLRRKFRGDRIGYVAGDRKGIIQTVRHGSRDAGRIVYACKPGAGWIQELDTRRVKALRERYRARAGIQVVTSERNCQCGQCVFIVSQKTILGFAAMVREGMLLCAKECEDFLNKQNILSHGTAL